MATTDEQMTHVLESAVEELDFALDAASIEFEIATSPNTNQYIVIFADGTRHAYVTAEPLWDGTPMVFVDIYSMDADGEENWLHGDLSVSDAITHIVNA